MVVSSQCLQPPSPRLSDMRAEIELRSHMVLCVYRRWDNRTDLARKARFCGWRFGQKWDPTVSALCGRLGLDK